MSGCVWCGSYHTQACHVKDKATFTDDRPHDFHNIVALCSACHNHYFDQRKMGFGPSCSFIIVLHCISFKRWEVREPQSAIYINNEYIAWKNKRLHMLLKAELRKLLRARPSHSS